LGGFDVVQPGGLLAKSPRLRVVVVIRDHLADNGNKAFVVDNASPPQQILETPAEDVANVAKTFGLQPDETQCEPPKLLASFATMSWTEKIGARKFNLGLLMRTSHTR
jgi:hypothetical protein